MSVIHNDATTINPTVSSDASQPTERIASGGGVTRRGAIGILGGAGLAMMAAASAGAGSGCGGTTEPPPGSKPTALVFDAYGTLFDVYTPVFDTAKTIYGTGYNDLFYQTLIQVWRLKQLENSWLRSLIGQYQDFYSCTVSGLDYALRAVGIDPEAEPAKRDQLAARYLTLDAYPEARDVLTQLKARGLKLAILSNGSRSMLDQVVRANNMENILDKWISVDEVRIFKPHRQVYTLAAPQLGVSANQILFVSSNSFDVLGAKTFGLQTCWIQRSATPPGLTTPMPTAVSPSMVFGMLRGRQELAEEAALLPTYVIPSSPTGAVGLNGLLTLDALQA